MNNTAQISISLSHPAVVGTVHDAKSLAAARRVSATACDWLELRVDNFLAAGPAAVAALRRVAGSLPRPRIVTVRHPSEGGAFQGLTAAERHRLCRDFLPVAGLIDIELRQAGAMREVIREAQEAGVGVILSHHDFRQTPSPAKLHELARRARELGADLFKAAAMTQGAGDLAKLIEFLANENRAKSRLPLAVMGMGPFGKVSRLALAQAGSRLNYGYLGSPNASGQWPVALLKARIAELTQAS